MSDTAAGGAAWSPERSAAGGHNPYLIAFVVSIATFMEVLDTTIANVALRHIAGGLAVGIDESTYVITSYLVANAIVLSISGWLSTVIGRKRFYMICVGTFALASLLCGLAWSLESLVLFRIIQGLGGGGMATSEQAILADSFPPAKRGQAFAIYGVAVVVAPVIGPTLGGWITDTYTWHWIFLINVPMGLLSLFLVGTLVKEPSGAEEQRKKLLKDGLRVDYIGFILVAIGLGSLEFVLDEGQRKDWFGSGMITGFAVASAVCQIALIPWELTRKDPIVDLRLLGRRQFGSCFLVMLCTGAVLISSTQLLPQLLQTELNYTALLAGLALSPGGIVTLILMPVVGNLVSRVQPKYLIALGGCIVAFSMWHLTGLTGDITYGYAALARIFLSAGLPFLFLPVTTASYDGVPPDKTNQASALINVARNIGGSMGVALAQTALAQRQQFHQSRLVEHAAPSDIGYQQTIDAMTRYFQAQGSNASDAAAQAIAWVGQTLQRQVDLLAYIDVFWLLSIIGLVMIPLALIIKPVDLSAPPKGHKATRGLQHRRYCECSPPTNHAINGVTGLTSREVHMLRTNLAGVSMSVVILAAVGITRSSAEPVLKGADAFGDWQRDKPGTVRLITPQDLPKPGATASSSNSSRVVSRPASAMPQVPAGFKIELFASGLSGPRIIRTAPNGDIFVVETSSGRILVLRSGEGAAKRLTNEIYASGLNRPFGIAFFPNGDNPQWLYVANTDSVVRFAYRNGDLKASAKPETIVARLPHGYGHSTRDIVFTPDDKRMLVSVGSAGNAGEGLGRPPEGIEAWSRDHALGAAWGTETDRAAVLAFDPDGKNQKLFATGIRNCVGLAIQPGSGTPWCSTNERDGRGDNLVPDYVTRIREGAFYGWPWYYIGANEDPAHAGERPDLKDKVTVPDVLLQAHSASLGLTFYTGGSFPPEYRGDAFAAEHGSWNRSKRTGYKVIRIRLKDGVPTGEYEDFVTGFVISDNEVWGRPVGVTVARDGALLVSEDGNGTIWRVSRE